MGDNKKPILSVLVDEEKKRLFADLARAHKQSMGWLLNQAIDKMLEAGTIYIYRDSIPPIDADVPKPLPSTDIEELIRSYVDKAIDPLASDLVNIQSQIINRDNWDDLLANVADLRELVNEVPAQIEELRAQITAISAKPASIAGHPNQKAKAATTAQGGQSTQEAEVQKWVRRLEANPGLRAAIEEGLSQNLTGKGLTEWVFSEGFGANENTKPFDSSVAARMRGAIEYLNSLENGGQD